MSLLGVSTFTDSLVHGAHGTHGARALAGAVDVDLDLSLFVQLGLFVVLMLVLKPVLFDPMMRLFEEREKRIEGTRHQATKEDERSAKALAKYETVLAKAREAGTAERDALKAEGLKREAALMAQVRAASASTLEQGRAEISKEAAAARSQLTADARALGKEMASRVLGREVAS